MRQSIPLERFLPEWDALTRPELVKGYEAVERRRERVSTGRRSWVDRVPLPDGRVEVRTYEQGRLVGVDRVMPKAAPDVKPWRGTYGVRLG